MADRKEDYRALCSAEPSIPLFCRDWWLDAVCGEKNWDVVLTGKDKIQGAMPFFTKKRGPFVISTLPQLTPHLGPWVSQSKGRYSVQLTHTFETMEALARLLPKVDYFLQNFSKETGPWTPFYWHGYKQTTYFSYILDTRLDLDALWDGFKSSIRGGIRKAEKLVQVRSGSLEEFLVLNRKTFSRQGLPLPYSEEYVRRIDAACDKNGRREILVAEDSQGALHAATYCVFDDRTTYYLLSGSDPEYRASQALTYVLWEAMRNAHNRGHTFDFEGSINRAIEQFIRPFNAIATPFSRITKASRLFEIGLTVSSLLTKETDQKS